MAENVHVRAKLMLPARHGLERDKRDSLPGPVDYRVVRDGRLGAVLLAGTRFAHAVAFRSRGLH